MAPKTRPEDEPFVTEEHLEPLPYRPTCKLTPIAGTYCAGTGWRSRQFRDAEGQIYERDRDGRWERWHLITRTEYEDGTVREAPKPEPEPFDYYEALDVIEDFYFIQGALRGWFDNAQAKARFSALSPALVERVSEAISQVGRSVIALADDLQRFHPKEQG